MGQELCPFCTGEPAFIGKLRAENGHCGYFEGTETVLRGSGVIMPWAHRETVFDLIPEEWTAIYQLLQRVKELLVAELRPDGFNVGWHCYPVGGQSIPHAHLHVSTTPVQHGCMLVACRLHAGGTLVARQPIAGPPAGQRRWRGDPSPVKGRFLTRGTPVQRRWLTGYTPGNPQSPAGYRGGGRTRLARAQKEAVAIPSTASAC